MLTAAIAVLNEPVRYGRTNGASLRPVLEDGSLLVAGSVVGRMAGPSRSGCTFDGAGVPVLDLGRLSRGIPWRERFMMVQSMDFAPRLNLELVCECYLCHRLRPKFLGRKRGAPTLTESAVGLTGHGHARNYQGGN